MGTDLGKPGQMEILIYMFKIILRNIHCDYTCNLQYIVKLNKINYKLNQKG